MDTASTPAGINPSNRNSSSSPPQSITLERKFPFDEFPDDFDLCDLPADYFGTTLPKHNDFPTNVMDYSLDWILSGTHTSCNTSSEVQDEQLRIISEPKAVYRERYSCEFNSDKQRAQRYIRTEYKKSKYEYPTVQIPSNWCHPTRDIYIQVTPVTVKNKKVPHHYIHPYEISTQEYNVIRDPQTNSLYFPVDENNFTSGEKSFHISRKKMVQKDLKSYGPLRLYGSDQLDLTQSLLTTTDPKQILAKYQLWKSHFIFTIAQRYDNTSLPQPFMHTSVISQVMTDVATEKQNLSPDQYSDRPTNTIKCIPQKGDWQGGDEILVVMPYPIKQKKYEIVFDFGCNGQYSAQQITHIDRKTFSFRTPSCPLPPGDQHLQVSMIIKENGTTFPSMLFSYISPITLTMNICPRCAENIMDNQPSNKRRCEYTSFNENDSGHILSEQMDQLSLTQKDTSSCSRLSSEENKCKIDKYLNQLKDALVMFVRTNDPSRLFRRTRVLLCKCDDNPPPLNDAIEHGHIDLALSLIEQVVDMSLSNGLLEKTNENGESALLMAAKYNEWKLIESIVKKRCDLVEKMDKDDNNVLHILANVNEDAGAETIRNLLSIIPNTLKVKLMNKKNKENRNAIEVAQLQGNTQCINWLNKPIEC